MKAVQLREYGGVDQLVYMDVPQPVPGPAEVLVRLEYAGLNFIDTYQRSGLYKLPQLPAILGREGAGIVAAVGAEVDPSVAAVGDRVAYFGGSGSYAQYATVPAWRVSRVPQNVDLKLAAAVPLQGMTAHYLTNSTYAVKEGDWVLIHAGAGGTGALMIQMAKLRGAHVITTVSSEQKAAIAKEAGADCVVNYTQESFVDAVQAATNGKGCHAVYDSVGKSTWEDSLRCVRQRGMLVCFGNASGPVPAFDPQLLNKQGSVFLTRPTLAHYCRDRSELEQRMGDIMRWIEQGSLKVRVGQVFSLQDVSKAHEALTSRSTVGKVVLEVPADVSPQA